MRSMQTIAVATAIAAASSLLATYAVQAQEEIDFGYEVNSTKSSTGKRLFHYAASTNTLFTTANATVDLTVGDGISHEFNDAEFDFSATAGATTTTGNQLSTPFSGSFSFYENGFDLDITHLILKVTFQDGVLTARDGGRNGALFQSDDQVQIEIGQAGINVGLPSVVAQPEGFSFAFGGASPRFSNGVGDGPLQAFNAKSSFLADATIPEPSGFVLTALGMLGFAALRRR